MAGSCRDGAWEAALMKSSNGSMPAAPSTFSGTKPTFIQYAGKNTGFLSRHAALLVGRWRRHRGLGGLDLDDLGTLGMPDVTFTEATMYNSITQEINHDVVQKSVPIYASLVALGLHCGSQYHLTHGAWFYKGQRPPPSHGQ